MLRFRSAPGGDAASPSTSAFRRSCHDAFGGARRGIVRRATGKTIGAVIGAVALMLPLAACGDTGTASGERPTVAFMLDWTPNTNHIGLYVAQQLGYYQDAGIDVTILPTAQAGAETSVENGVADIGFTTLSNVAAFNAQGADLKFVFDLTQRPVARWCALASRTDITTPKDFDGKTFVSFGSAEQSAVVTQMIRDAGGTGEFDTATAGTNTFATLTSGNGDFAGFYATWEGVQSELDGPALNCFAADDWGVPGNPDQLGFAVNASWLDDADHQSALRTFLDATRQGYDYALAHPYEAADLLVEEASTAQLDPDLTRASMRQIVDGGYWTGDGMQTDATAGGDAAQISGRTNLDDAQHYLDFQYQAGTYADATGKNPATAPQAADLATNDYIS